VSRLDEIREWDESNGPIPPDGAPGYERKGEYLLALRYCRWLLSQVERLREAAQATLEELRIIRAHWDTRPMFVHADTKGDLAAALAALEAPASAEDGEKADDD
jgi:hypothetical protein